MLKFEEQGLLIKLPANLIRDGEPYLFPSPQLTIGDRVYFKEELRDEEARACVIQGMKIKWHIPISNKVNGRHLELSALGPQPRWSYFLCYEDGEEVTSIYRDPSFEECDLVTEDEYRASLEKPEDYDNLKF